MVPTIIIYALRGAYAHRKEYKESIKIFNTDGPNVAPTIDYVEQTMKEVLDVYRCIL